MADQMELSSGSPTPNPQKREPAPTTPMHEPQNPVAPTTPFIITQTMLEAQNAVAPTTPTVPQMMLEAQTQAAAQPPEPTRTCNDEEAQPPKKKQRKDALTVVLAKKPINAGMWAHTDNKEKQVSFVYCQCRTYPDDRNAF